MRLYNPTTNLGGEQVKEGENFVFKPGNFIVVDEKTGFQLLNKYPFLKNPDSVVYGPDWNFQSMNWWQKLLDKGLRIIKHCYVFFHH